PSLPLCSALFPYTTLFRSVVFTVINAAISAGYYLKIVGAMFLRPEPEGIVPSRVGQLAAATGDALAPALPPPARLHAPLPIAMADRKSTRLNSSHEWISYA